MTKNIKNNGRPVNLDRVLEAKEKYKTTKNYRAVAREMKADVHQVWRWVNNYDRKGRKIVAVVN